MGFVCLLRRTEDVWPAERAHTKRLESRKRRNDVADLEEKRYREEGDTERSRRERNNRFFVVPGRLRWWLESAPPESRVHRLRRIRFGGWQDSLEIPSPPIILICLFVFFLNLYIYIHTTLTYSNMPLRVPNALML
jgi:hypothetical protein